MLSPIHTDKGCGGRRLNNYKEKEIIKKGINSLLRPSAVSDSSICLEQAFVYVRHEREDAAYFYTY